MSRVIHVFRAPDRFVAGTVGEPGERTFYLQAVDEARVISVALEKEQVAVLAERLSALLDEVVRRLGADISGDSEEPGVDTEPLRTPVEQEFRVGTMGLGWDVESRAIVVELLAVTEQELDESVVLDDTEEGPDALRVFLSLQQARAFTARAERVVSAGRRPCPLCTEPLGPKGHICPRQNGYRRQVEA
ncbi:MAG: DUF3090 domain-containing protein [Pseudonocardiaceae bacterium]